MMNMISRNPWMRAGFAAWSLGIEASTVIMLRTMKIASGGAAAEREIYQMITEKIEAGIDLQTKAMTGELGFTPESATNKTLSHYRRKVRANRRRLTKV
jgi:hypothetical protein